MAPSLNRPILAPKPLRHRHRSPTKVTNNGQVEPFNGSVPIYLIMLEENLCLSNEVGINFPPSVNDVTICEVIN